MGLWQLFTVTPRTSVEGMRRWFWIGWTSIRQKYSSFELSCRFRERSYLLPTVLICATILYFFPEFFFSECVLVTALHSNALAQLAKAMVEPSEYVSRGKLIAHVICGSARKIGHDHQNKVFNVMDRNIIRASFKEKVPVSLSIHPSISSQSINL